MERFYLLVFYCIFEVQGQATLTGYFPTFDSFANRHILDPALFVNVSTLTSAELNEVFRQRAATQHSIDPGAGDLRRQSKHIFLIGNLDEVKESFHRGPYKTIFNESIPMTNLGISDRSFATRLLLRKKGHSPRPTYAAWDCGLKYIVAGLNMQNEPMYINALQDSSILFFPFSIAPPLNPSLCTRIK